MKKKGGFVRILSLFLSCILTCCLFCFQSKASSNLDGFYHISMNTPPADDLSGYFEVLYENNYGTFVAVYFWTIYRNSSDYVPSMQIGILGDSVSFYLSGGEATLYRMTSDGIESPTVLSFLESGDTSVQNVPNIKAFHVYGQASVTNHSVDQYSGNNFLVVYNDILPLYEKLYSIYHYLLESGVTKEQLDTLLLDSASIKDMLISILGFVQQEFSYVEQMYFFFNSWDLYFMNLNELTSISYYVWELWDKFTSFTGDLLLFPSDSDDLSGFEDSNKVQQDKLDEYVEESQVEKPTPEDVDYVIDSNLDLQGVADFSVNFGSITAHPYVLQMLLIVFTCALVSFILFGKRS